MSGILEKLKNLIPKLEDDGSKELALQYKEMIEHEGLMNELENNAGFKKILEMMRKDFTEKILVHIQENPELKEMYKMFVRVTGQKGASENVAKMIDEIIDNPRGE